MSRLNILITSVACMSLLVTGIAFAQGPEPTPGPIKVTDLASWATTTPPDWGRGVLFALLGLVGALVTIFGLIGGAVPGTAGQVRIDADSERLARLTEELEKLITASDHPLDAAAIRAVETAVNNLRDDLWAERWRQWAVAGILYAVLGACFSALLAKDMLQALVLGAGWTGILGSLGLRKDYAQRKEIKDSALEKILERAKKAEEILKGTRKHQDLPPEEILKCLTNIQSLPPDELLEREVRIAKAL